MHRNELGQSIKASYNNYVASQKIKNTVVVHVWMFKVSSACFVSTANSMVCDNLLSCFPGTAGRAIVLLCRNPQVNSGTNRITVETRPRKRKITQVIERVIGSVVKQEGMDGRPLNGKCSGVVWESIPTSICVSPD